MDTQELNLVVVRGRVAVGAQIRSLTDGTTQLQWDMVVAGDRIPVTWAALPDNLPAAGVDLLVFGRVKRRFFRAGAATQSRTEVVAERVLSGTDRRRTRKALDEMAVRLAPS